MSIRSLALKFVILSTLLLVGCQNAIEGLKRDLQIGSWISTPVIQPITCYRTFGNSVRLFSGADCGTSGYFLSEILQEQIQGQYEENRIANEYQNALNANPLGNAQHKIYTVVSEGQMVIDIRAFAGRYYGQTLCRSFFEHTTVNNITYSDKGRNACRDGDKWSIMDK